jgi:hypothetical protein
MKESVLSLYAVFGIESGNCGPGDEPLMIVPARNAHHATARARLFGSTFPTLGLPTTLSCRVHDPAFELVRSRFGFIPEGFFDARERINGADPPWEDSSTAIQAFGTRDCDCDQ